MPATTYLPSRESELIIWSTAFNGKINLAPSDYGLDAAQATAYTGLHVSFFTTYQSANDPSTRTKPSILAKNAAKDALIDGVGGIRYLVNIIQSAPGMTNAKRADLGITVRDTEPTPVPAPSQSPEIDIDPPVVRSVRIRLHNEKILGRRGKPDGVQGALVFSYVGTTPPAAEDTKLWEFEINTTKTTVDLQFPSSVEPGATVWITALWYNPRGNSGPATPPVYTLLPGSLAQAA